MAKIVIFGTGDISEIAWLYISKEAGNEVVAFTVDKAFNNKEEFCGLKVFDFEDIEKKFSPKEYLMFIPLSYTKINALRRQKFYEAKEKGYNFYSYISPHCFRADNVKIGENCFVLEDNTLQPCASIGNNCVIWSGNHIGHHSKIADHCFLASHIVISGGTEIGEETFVGVNATFRDHIKVGRKNVIGAGAIIMKDTADEMVFIAQATEPRAVPSSKLRGI